jgi:hypothetical protein
VTSSLLSPHFVLASDARRRTLRAFARSVAPEMAALDETAWLDVESTIARMLETRPRQMQRQVLLLLRVLEHLPILRYGRPLSSLDDSRRSRFLESLQRSRVPLVRRGIWGLRTLVLMGFYTRAETMRAVGYRAATDGWRARAELTS